jgi:two-component system heavy metal sensor histidine kinase CusS
VLYAVSTTALLVVTAGFLYWTLKRNLEAAQNGLVASKLEVVQLLLRDQPAKSGALESEVEHEAGGSHLLRYYVRILDDEGRVLLATSGMDELLPPSAFPPPLDASDGALRSPRRQVRPRGAFVLICVRAAYGQAGQEHRTVQLAQDVTGSDVLLEGYRHRLLAMLVVGVVFAALAGMWVARKGVQPLVSITQTAQHITASQLDERIGQSGWPSELTELARAFDAMLDRLQSSFLRLSQFSADLAHEMRTPINNLRGEAEVALARTRTPDDYRHVLSSSLEEFDRLSRMMDGLLFMARADDPATALERVHFDGRMEVEAVKEFYEALAGEQQVTINCQGEATLDGDPVLFRRAVSNLLANAIRHTPAGGKVHIALRRTDNGGVILSVADTGSGIAPEHLKRLFDRFYRVDGARPQGHGGTGLGLAIVQSIMRLHGGTASVQSRVGEGSVFTLTFPASTPGSLDRKMTEM